MEIYGHGVAQMDAYRKPSIIVSPDQLVAYRYMAATAWERLRQEGRSNGLVWFDPEYRVVPDAQRRHGPYSAQLTTVATGVVHDRSYTNSQGWLIENIATGRMQVSVQFPKGADGQFQAVWISDFDAATGPSENDPYYCEAVDWHSPLRKGMRK
nr:MAG TPA: hypothetical protein [Caudoviricetes sp.]